MSASAGLRPPIEASRSSSPPVEDDQQTAAAAAAEDSGISEADPGYCCRTPTSEGSRLPPAPLNCPPPPRKRKYWRRRRRPPPPQVLELVAVEAEELEQLFQRRGRAVEQPPTAKRVKKVQDSDHDLAD